MLWAARKLEREVAWRERPVRSVPIRHRCAGPPDPCRTGAGRRTPVPCPAHPHRCQHGRLSQPARTGRADGLLQLCRAGALSVRRRVRQDRATSSPTARRSTPTGVPGRSEAVYVTERLIDHAARELGVSGAELRAKNLVAESDLPYTTAVGSLLDSGNAAALLERARDRRAGIRDSRRGARRRAERVCCAGWVLPCMQQAVAAARLPTANPWEPWAAPGRAHDFRSSHQVAPPCLSAHTTMVRDTRQPLPNW